MRFAEPFPRVSHTGINMTGKDVEREIEAPSARGYLARHRAGGSALAVALVLACGTAPDVSKNTGGLTTGTGAGAVGGTGAAGGTGGSGADASGGTGADPSTQGGMGAQGGGSIIDPNQGQQMQEECPPTTCTELGYACGAIVDACGKVINCKDEGLECGPLEACVGGVDTPTQCVVGGGEPCELCGAVPDCSTASQPTTITGRVVTPGRTDSNVPNQVGVPNAFVYILRNKGVGDLPAIHSGIPAGGTSCDRCEDQDLGPVLVGTVTDATGAFKLEGNVPVGDEFTMVVKAGRFRRAFAYTLPMEAACQTTAFATALPENPTRLPRNMLDGLAVNIPRIAVSTGAIDAMECVLEKMGLSHEEFGNPGAAGDAAARVHLYRGRSNANLTEGDGVSIDASTPLEDVLYGDPERLKSYDIVLADCEGQYADSSGGGRNGSAAYAERDEFGENVIDYVNRGGRMFASHLRYTWLYQNGTQAYDPANPFTTGLANATSWELGDHSSLTTGAGVVSVGRPDASPRIQAFADWMNSEMVAAAPTYTFDIDQPRSQANVLGESSEEFVYTSSVTNSMMTATTADKVQQFSFNTPYGAPDDQVCGRVAYSGFHVSIGDTTDAIFPAVCTGDLTKQEKVLLYMLFDLATCVGDTPPPPECTPTTCEALEVKCGFTGDGCGKVLDCGPCPIPVTR